MEGVSVMDAYDDGGGGDGGGDNVRFDVMTEVAARKKASGI